MIYQLVEPLAIRPILELMSKRQDIFDIPLEQVAKYLFESVEDDNSLILIDEKDEIIGGVLYASVEEFNGEDVVFIHACMINPTLKNTGFEFMARVRRWADSKGLNKILFVTDNHVEGYMRKYNFTNMGTILGIELNKEIENEQFLQRQVGKN